MRKHDKPGKDKDKNKPAAVIAGIKLEEVEIKNYKAKAYAFIINSLSNDVLTLFMNIDAEADLLYMAIKQHYERDTIASKHALRQLMMSQRLSRNEDINNYVSRINTYSQQLKGMGDVIIWTLLFSLFYGLPQEYSAFVLNIKNTSWINFC